MRKILILVLMLLLSAISFAADKASTNDPSEIMLGARALGLGRAYVAVADDANSVFINPAGLGAFTGMQLTSTHTELLNEVSYNSVAGALPSKYGTFGFGVTIAQVGDSLLTQRNPLTDRIEVAGGSTFYNNTITYLSYGNKVGKISNNLYAGLSLKLFSQTLSGAPASSGSGFDLDAGLLYRPLPWLTLGASAQNILPDSISKVTWTSGATEGIPTSIKLGTKIKLLGEGARDFKDQTLFAAIDANFNDNRPSTYHAGLEWQPVSVLSVRAGIDQSANANEDGTSGVVSNFTGGIGFVYRGIRFDYAYHQFNGLAENNSNIFTVSYVGELPFMNAAKRNAKKSYEAQNLVVIASPADCSVVKEKQVDVQGSVADSVTKVKVGAETSYIGGDSSFSVSQPLIPGKNLVRVELYDENGNKTGEYGSRVLRLVKFYDVDKEYWAASQIEEAATLGFIGGSKRGIFNPDSRMTRVEFATALVKAKQMPLPTGNLARAAFKDVSGLGRYEAYVKAAVDTGLMKGYSDMTFKPEQYVSRIEAITAIAKFSKMKPVSTDKTSSFSDIPTDDPKAPLIAAFKEAGMLDYIVSDQLRPDKPVTKAEFVYMLAKTRTVMIRANDLKNFDTGYYDTSKAVVMKRIETPTYKTVKKAEKSKKIKTALKKKKVSKKNIASKKLKRIAYIAR